MIIRDVVIKNVSKVTNNVKIIDYISECIEYINGKSIINFEFHDKCNYAFKNSDGERLYIHLSTDSVYVYVNTLEGYQDVLLENDGEDTVIEFNKSIVSCDDNGFKNIISSEEKSFYNNKNFICSDSVDSSITILDGCIVKDLMCSNYDKHVMQYRVDDEIVKIEKINYHYLSDMSSVKYYISDCVDIYGGVLPKYEKFNGDFSKYEDKINLVDKKNSQNKKTMV